VKRASLAITLGLLAITIAIGLATIGMRADDDAQFHFIPNSLVVSRSVYAGTADTVTVRQTLPPGCVAGTVVVPVLAGGSANVKGHMRHRRCQRDLPNRLQQQQSRRQLRRYLAYLPR
jgi:hypothetical protein